MGFHESVTAEIRGQLQARTSVMRWTFRTVAAGLLGIIALPANADPTHQADWVIAGEDRPEQIVTQTDRGYFKVGRIVPARLLALRTDIVLMFAGKLRVMISAGTPMVPVVGNERRACILRGIRGTRFPCLIDKDGDGRYDTYSGTQVFHEIFFNSSGDDGKEIPLNQAVELDPQDSKSATPPIALGLRYLGSKNGAARYQMCVLTDWKEPYKDSPICERKVSWVPLEPGNRFTMFGHSIGVTNAESKPASVTVRYGREDVPFNVFALSF